MSSGDLFAVEPQRPLAERMRPRSIDEVMGQAHLLAAGRPLRQAVDSRQLHSMILWGPPGCGKTTMARLVARASEADFIALSAVLAGVADIRKAIGQAEANRSMGRATVLFVDEVHRFNKAQQDAFLPHVESGLIWFIGATTENPSFEVNNALLSRLKLYVLKALSQQDLELLLGHALADEKHGYGGSVRAAAAALRLLARAADGDARRALNLLELAASLAEDGCIDQTMAATVAADSWRRFDRGQDAYYEQISALHKSIRSSDADAALYWLCRMLDGGCDPRYIARRLLRMASEDIGNADPQALSLTLSAWDSYQRLGSPEGELALAQAACYLACAPKSNAVYQAFGQAMRDAKDKGSLPVPERLCNAPTALHQDLGYGRDYQYDHDHGDGVAVAQRSFPDEMTAQAYYQPSERGWEGQLRQRLLEIRAARYDIEEESSGHPSGAGPVGRSDKPEAE